MFSVEVKLHKLKCNSAELIPDKDGYFTLCIEEGSSVQDLMDGLGISERFGKTILINSILCKDYGNFLIENDKIEIFQMFAGG
jgi:sulfur carrier protein ThiS